MYLKLVLFQIFIYYKYAPSDNKEKDFNQQKYKDFYLAKLYNLFLYYLSNVRILIVLIFQFTYLYILCYH